MSQAAPLKPSQILFCNPYIELNVGKASFRKEIKEAFRAKSKEFHPNKGPENETASAQEKFKVIQQCYRILHKRRYRVQFILASTEQKCRSIWKNAQEDDLTGVITWEYDRWDPERAEYEAAQRAIQQRNLQQQRQRQQQQQQNENERRKREQQMRVEEERVQAEMERRKREAEEREKQERIQRDILEQKLRERQIKEEAARQRERKYFAEKEEQEKRRQEQIQRLHQQAEQRKEQRKTQKEDKEKERKNLELKDEIILAVQKRNLLYVEKEAKDAAVIMQLGSDLDAAYIKLHEQAKTIKRMKTELEKIQTVDLVEAKMFEAKSDNHTLTQTECFTSGIYVTPLQPEFPSDKERLVHESTVGGLGQTGYASNNLGPPSFDDISHICKTCKKSFSQKRSLVEHRETVHKMELVFCGFCSKSYTRAYNLARHISEKH